MHQSYHCKVPLPPQHWRDSISHLRLPTKTEIGNLHAAASSEVAPLSKDTACILGDYVRWAHAQKPLEIGDFNIKSAAALQRTTMRLEKAVRTIAQIESICEMQEGEKRHQLATGKERLCTNHRSQQVIDIILGLKMSNSGSKSSDMLAHLINGTVPPVLRRVVQETKWALPSKSTLSRRQLSLDFTICETEAERLESCDGPIYLGMDSSCQGIARTNWLISHYYWVERFEVVPVVRAIQTMKKLKLEFLALCKHHGCNIGDNEEVSNRKMRIVEERVYLGDFVKRRIHTHRMIPMAVTGNEDLEGKMRALSQQIYAQSRGQIQFVSKFSKQVRANCTDRGTEMYSVDAASGGLPCYLPPWVRAHAASQACSAPAENSTINAEASAGPSADGRPSALQALGPALNNVDGMQAEAGTPALPHCLKSGGFCHGFANIEEAMDKRLPRFDAEFLPSHKVYVVMLGRSDILHDMVTFILPGTQYSDCAFIFGKKCPQIKMWRWSTLRGSLEYRWERMNVMRYAYTAAKLLHERTEIQDQSEFSKAGTLNLQLVEEISQSSRQWGLTKCYFLLHDFLMKCRSWCEGCECHDFLQADALTNKVSPEAQNYEELLALLPSDQRLLDGRNFP